MTQTRAAAPRRTGRIGGLDLARGLAVLGMFGAHLRLGEEIGPVPDDAGRRVVDGRSSILFATLAGRIDRAAVGPDPAAGRHRTWPAPGCASPSAPLWVFAIGAVLEWLDTFVAVILGVYAVLFVLVLPFLRWPVRRLLVLAGVVARRRAAADGRPRPGADRRPASKTH